MDMALAAQPMEREFVLRIASARLCAHRAQALHRIAFGREPLCIAYYWE